MRMMSISAVFSALLLSGCAGAHGGRGMDHGAMSHEQMMQHCEMMERGGTGHDAAAHDPAQHGGMSHEEMMRHCEMLLQQRSAPDAQSSADPHRH